MAEDEQRDLFETLPPTTKERFIKFHEDNPVVYERLKEMTFQVRQLGRKKLSGRTLWEVLRWNIASTVVEEEEPYKLNDHYLPHYVRMMIGDFPVLDGFFELRRLRKE